MQSGLFVGVGQAWLGDSIPQGQEDLLRGASEASWPVSSVCSQPQRHVIPMVALLLTNVCFPRALWIGVYVMNFWATPGGFATLSVRNMI